MSTLDEVTGSSTSGSGSTVDPPKTTRRGGRIGLLGKTSITLLLVGLVPLIVFGVITLNQQRKELRSTAEQSMRNNTEAISALVDEWFDKNVRVLRAAVNQPAIAGMQGDQQKAVLVAQR